MKQSQNELIQQYDANGVQDYVRQEIGKKIHWKLSKRLNFNNITKRYIHKSVSVQEYQARKIIRDFKIRMNLLIPVR